MWIEKLRLGEKNDKFFFILITGSPRDSDGRKVIQEVASLQGQTVEQLNFD